MDEEISIIDSSARKERLKNFLVKNKKRLILSVVSIIFLLVFYFLFKEFQKSRKVEISDLYNTSILEYSENNKDKILNNLVYIINKEDPTYSPLSLYFIIDNNLVSDKEKMNNLFETVINYTPLEEEIKNLIIYKKGLFFADEINENDLLVIFNPLINSESIWKPHALYVLAEFFYDRGEKSKAKEFFQKILLTTNADQDIKSEAQKRLNRDLSE
tara:strand:- start:3061 stop:3705 length:645 start_codon:yes stop_codon:yes gene_type:complete